MSEQELQSKIRAALSSPERIVFRTNAGEFWQGKLVYSQEFGQCVLINLRKVDGLPKGFSDLLVVDGDGVAFVETKAPNGRASDEQKRFLSIMRGMGHRAGIAKTVEEAIAICKGSE